MRVLFVCGGTAGHINPAISIADTLKSKFPEVEILFVGNPKGIEATLVPKAGYHFSPLEVAGLQRKINLRNVFRNMKAGYLLVRSFPKAAKIIKRFSPDIVFGTGGYVSGPVVRKAHQMGYKTITHESNAYPGITTKLLSKDVDKVLVATEGAKKYLNPETHKKVRITGNPVRQAILRADRQTSRERLGVGDRICLLSFGGSLGAQRINESVAEFMKRNYKSDKIYHIHATGKENYDEFIEMLKKRDVDYENSENLDIRRYIDNMAVCMAAADLVVCRAGAVTISEIIAVGKAAILIPSPNVAENHQYHNAMELVNKGAAKIIEEKDLTEEIFCGMVSSLADNPEEISNIEKAALKLYPGDANELIVGEITELISE